MEKLAAFVAASKAQYNARYDSGKVNFQSRLAHVADMLHLDAGLRAGEVMGLQWGDVEFGSGPEDRGRHIHVCRSVSQVGARERHVEKPKSGRTRDVHLSRRLRRLLLEFRMAQGNPGDEEWVLTDKFYHGNYRTRQFAEVRRAAGIPDLRPKDLRSTYASWLLTVGAPIPYVSEQLGHSDIATTLKHYARWLDKEGDRDPMKREPGEVWADVIARVVDEWAQETAATEGQSG